MSRLLDLGLICLKPNRLDASSIALSVYERTCRSGFEAPGFCVVNVGSAIQSTDFRQLMVDIKCAMGLIHASRTDEALIYLSAARFDQQETTKLHLDGGPDECFLMLGYEPSTIESELVIADYAKCAFDLGLGPKEFMAKHNPMFSSGAKLLRPYATRVPCFDCNEFQILCINNSCADYAPSAGRWQGTLHTATIVRPDESKRRIINSTMIARAPRGTGDLIDEQSLQRFVRTTEVKRRGYDKVHLVDDE